MQTSFRLLFFALSCLFASVALAPAQTAGSLDSSFLAQTDATVRTVIVQSDGKILIGGDFTMVNDTPRQHLARLNADGSLDPDFDPGADGPVYALALQPADNLIVVGGSFNLVGGASAGGNIGRLLPDGTPDLTFVKAGAYTDGPVHALAVLRDGKIALGGDFFILSGQGHPNIGYLHGDGSIAADVIPPAPNGPVYAIALNALGDGVVFGGAFTFLEDDKTLIYNNIAALDNNGALDATFNPGKGANNTVYSLLDLAGSYLAGGLFTTYDGVVDGGLTFIKSNGGVVDVSYTPIPLANGIIYTLAFQRNVLPSIAVGGSFNSFSSPLGSVTYNHVTQLVIGSGGAVQPNFDPNSGTDGTVYSVAYQADGKLLVGGNFKTYNGVPRVGLARVYGQAAINLSVNFSTISRATGQKAKVTFTRAGTASLDTQITVNFKLSGPLVNGADYQELDGSAIIPAGATKTIVKVKPIPGGAIGKIKLTLQPNPGFYNVGTAPKVKINVTN